MGGHVKHLITAYVHNELPPHLRRRVAGHINQCAECYAALCREQELDRLLGTALPVMAGSPPRQFGDLLPGIMAEVNQPVRRGWHFQPGVMVAVLFTLLAVLLMPILNVSQATAGQELRQPEPVMIAATAQAMMTDTPQQGLEPAASPTAVAQRVELAIREEQMRPVPVPVLDTPGR